MRSSHRAQGGLPGGRPFHLLLLSLAVSSCGALQGTLVLAGGFGFLCSAFLLRRPLAALPVPAPAGALFD